MFERFTERAKSTLMFAQKESQALKHGYIGTEHILFGVASVEGTGNNLLHEVGVTKEFNVFWLWPVCPYTKNKKTLRQ